MKTLTSGQEAARITTGHSVAWLIDLDGIFYSTRSTDVFSPDASKTFVPLLSIGSIRDRNADKGIETLPKIQRINFSILIKDTYGVPIDQQVDDTVGGFLGKPVIYYKVFQPIPGAAAAIEADWITMFRGEIEEVTEISATRVSFMAVDFSKYDGGRSAIRKITRNLFATAPEANLGDVIPIIFGTVPECPGIQVSQGNASALGADLKSTETEMTVDDSTVFAASGKVQVGNEKIAYTSRDTTGPILRLLGLTRGRDGTTAADHSSGSVVTQLQAIKFLIADHALSDDFGAAGTVKDANGSVFDVSDYSVIEEEIPSGSGKVTTSIDVEDTGFPNIVETLTLTVKKDLSEDLGDDNVVAGDWQEGALNLDVTDFANSFDSDEATKHVTAATVLQSERLHVEQTKDLSSQVGEIKKVLAFIDYAIIPSRDEDWPSTSPEFQVTENGNVAASVTKDLGEPTEILADTKLFPLSDSDAPTTDLFQVTGTPLGNTTQHDIVFQEIAGNTSQEFDITEGPGSAFVRYWNGFGAFSPGDTIPDGKIKRSSAWDILNGIAQIDEIKTAQPGSLVVKLDPSDLLIPVTATSITVTATVIGENTTDSDNNFVSVSSIARARIQDGGPTVATGTRTGIDTSGFKTVSVTHTGSFTDTDLKGMRFLFDTPDFNATNLFMGKKADPFKTGFDYRARYLIDFITVTITAGTGIVGQTDPMDSTSIVPSQRVTQSTLITGIVEIGGGWDWFGNTNTPGLALLFPAQSNDYAIKVYSVGFIVEVLETSTRATLPSEFTLRADATGIIGATPTTYSARNALFTILGTPGFFYNLSGADIDTASLDAALDIVAERLSSQNKDDWIFQRRLSEPLTNRELLRQALTDAGIRCVIEGGKFKFFPSISVDPNVETVVGGIDSDKMSSPVRTPVSITLVTNDLTLQYSESLVSKGQFESEISLTDAESIVAIKSRATTIQSKFIRDDDVAAALAAHIINDFSLPRSIVRFSVQGARSIGLEVGDAITLSDDFSRFPGQLCRIMGISPAVANESELMFEAALSNAVTVLWQHGESGDDDFSTIAINTLTRTLLFTVDNVLVAQINGEALSLKGGMLDGLWPSSVENVTAQADPALARSNGTGLVEYVAAPGNGLSNGQISLSVYNGSDAKYYRVVTLGYNTDAGPLQFVSMFHNSSSSDPAYPKVLPSFTWNIHIDSTNASAGVDGDGVFSADLLRSYMTLEKFLNGSAINGEVIVNTIKTNVDL